MSFEANKTKSAMALPNQSFEKFKQSLFKRKEISDKNNSMILENDSLVDDLSDKVSNSCKDYQEQECPQKTTKVIGK